MANVMMPLVKVTKTGLKFLAKHSNLILSIIAITGAVAAVPITIYGTIKAVKIAEEKEVKGFKEVVKTTWKCFIPTIGIVLITTVAIASNGHINAKRLAMVTGLYMTTRDDLKKQTDKIKEMLGPGKEQKLKDEVAKEDLKEDLSKPEVVEKLNAGLIHETGHGDHIFKEHWTGQFFRASIDFIDLVCEKTNNSLDNSIDNVIQFSLPREMLSLERCGLDETVFDKNEMLRKGYNKITFDVTNVEWMDINGKKEPVSELWIRPSPTTLF